MKRIQQLTSCYLVLCLAFAGAIGISPCLHQLIEHGGNGPAHAHRGDASNFSITAHTHDHGIVHPKILHSERATHPTDLFAHSYKPFELPTIPLHQLWHAFSHLLDVPTPSESSTSNDGPGHGHHSLFQLIASGLVDQPLDLPLPSFVPYEFAFPNLSQPTFVAARDWDAQTATRGPPSSRS